MKNADAVLTAVIILIASAMIALFLLVWHIDSASAHGWYDHSCCDNDDCKPVKKIQSTMGGQLYWVHDRSTPIFVPNDFWSRPENRTWDGKGRVRPSKDGQHHICAFPVWRQGKAEDFIRCIYQPAGA